MAAVSNPGAPVDKKKKDKPRKGAKMGKKEHDAPSDEISDPRLVLNGSYTL